ncbi:MAG: aminotransferase class IV [Phycisphaerae bacterium]
MTLVMINGKIVDSSEAKVSAWDRGLYFGDGVYEVVQGYAGKLWGFTQHFRRFQRSLREIEILDVNLSQIEQWVFLAFQEAKMPNCVVYFHITRGCGIRSHVPGDDLGRPQFLLYVKPAPNNTKRVANGISAITCPDIRWKRCDIKTLNLLPNVMASQAAHKVGAEEAIFVSDGTITEGASSCFFSVLDGKLVTRPLDHQVLPSVTRQAILVIAEKIGLEIIERPITIREGYHAEEAFVSSSGYEIRPIIKIDDHVISGGKPGVVTSKIIERFLSHTRSGEAFDDLVKDTRFQLLPAL